MSPLRILFLSVSFPPSVGGLERVSSILAREFGRLGHEVAVVTSTAGPDESGADYRLLRQPPPRTVARLARWADVVFHNNIALRLGWPQIVAPKPWVVAHHMWIPRTGRGALAGHFKRLAIRYATNISVSHAIAASLNVPSVVIGNPYDDQLFRARPDIERTREIAFVGRLIPEKGADILLRAVAQVRRRGQPARLTIFGTGPDEPRLRRLTHTLGLDADVRFAGALNGEQLVSELCTHRVLAVPSVWEEPFGVVVLEGLACGLVPIVARSGGLPDAVGPCGVIVPKGDPQALAAALERVLCQPGEERQLLRPAGDHLAQHTAERVATSYLSVIGRAARGSEALTHAAPTARP